MCRCRARSTRLWHMWLNLIVVDEHSANDCWLKLICCCRVIVMLCRPRRSAPATVRTVWRSFIAVWSIMCAFKCKAAWLSKSLTMPKAYSTPALFLRGGVLRNAPFSIYEELLACWFKYRHSAVHVLNIIISRRLRTAHSSHEGAAAFWFAGAQFKSSARVRSWARRAMNWILRQHPKRYCCGAFRNTVKHRKSL